MNRVNSTRLWSCSGWALIADRDEVFPDDPGQGTPLMVEAPNGATATLQCVLGESVVGEGTAQAVEVPLYILCWLTKVEDEAEAWVFAEGLK